MSSWTTRGGNGRRIRRAVLAAAVAALALATAGCGDSGGGNADSGSSASEAATDAGGSGPTAEDSAPGTDAAGEPFGPGCGDLPKDSADPSSAAAMAAQPVGSAVAANPSLSTLAGAIAAVPGFADQLDAAQDLTFFAPTDAAFQKIDPATLQGLLADPGALSNVLSYHVVGQTLTKANVTGTFPTLAGEDQTLTIQGNDTGFTINGNAQVVCGNLPTSNATLYLIDTVLMPA